MDIADFGLYIRKRSIELNLSLSEVAKQSCMSRNNLYKLMACNAENTRISTLVNLASVLKTHPIILLNHLFENVDFVSSSSSSFSIYSYDASGFIQDITIPANTRVKPKQRFKKKWLIQNIGSVKWINRFFICVDEDTNKSSQNCTCGFSTPKRSLVPDNHKVAIDDLSPGERTEVSVEFTSPAVAGSCISYWKMCDYQENLCFPEKEELICLVQVLSL